jgi:hypothetical protein
MYKFKIYFQYTQGYKHKPFIKKKKKKKKKTKNKKQKTKQKQSKKNLSS